MKSFISYRTLISLSDIERTYGGGKKPLASRVPVTWGGSYSRDIDGHVEDPNIPSDQSVEDVDDAELGTPPITEGMIAAENLELHSSS